MPDCESCRAACVQFNTEPPDCEKCVPPLLKVNEDAILIWRLTESQAILGGMAGAAIAVNHLAVWEAIDRYKIGAPMQCFEKVLILWAKVTQPRLNRKADDGD